MFLNNSQAYHETQSGSFSDVGTSQQASGYIVAAIDKGIISGLQMAPTGHMNPLRVSGGELFIKSI
ncbi:hypothetical protein BA724_13290 [Domibacillus iocasae]|uniref:Uncharacterized protein n=1 Tax=Domibacillus iocasae TaxID=1714016 RepID=A0A1E7DJY8_9BACI|nr:hypothetical protein BA724_13290 [Domibacillus iocasae]